jgi:hypothetical protein
MVNDFIEDHLVPQHCNDQEYLYKVENCVSQVFPLPKFRNVEFAYIFKSEGILEQFIDSMAANLSLCPFFGGAAISLNNLFEAPAVLRSALNSLSFWECTLQTLLFNKLTIYTASICYDLLNV